MISSVYFFACLSRRSAKMELSGHCPLQQNFCMPPPYLSVLKLFFDKVLTKRKSRNFAGGCHFCTPSCLPDLPGFSSVHMSSASRRHRPLLLHIFSDVGESEKCMQKFRFAPFLHSFCVFILRYAIYPYLPG